jgi:CheY-like chemotaxis protein
MPVMSGYQVLEALSADRALCTLTVIVLTASTAPAPGFALVLRKPIHIDELLAAVHSHCE